jgi:hypothetical protein
MILYLKYPKDCIKNTDMRNGFGKVKVLLTHMENQDLKKSII